MGHIIDEIIRTISAQQETEQVSPVFPLLMALQWCFQVFHKDVKKRDT